MKKRASHLLAVQRGRDEQSVPQKPLPRGDCLPLAVFLRHETVRALDIILGDAGVHVAEQPEQVEVVEVESDDLGPPDGVGRLVAVVLGHDFPSRVSFTFTSLSISPASFSFACRMRRVWRCSRVSFKSGSTFSSKMSSSK